MKSAIVAIDATRDSGRAIQNLSDGLIRFQKAGLLKDLHLVSVIHPDSFLIPHSYYRDEKFKLGATAVRELQEKLDPKLEISSSRVLYSDNRDMEEHIAAVGKLGREVGAEVLVVGSSGKSTLSYLIEGSFSESASLNSEVPVLVFGEGAGSAHNSRPAKVLVAYSSSNPLSVETRRWIAGLAIGFDASIVLLPVDDGGAAEESAKMLRRDLAVDGVASVIASEEPVLPGYVPSVADQEQVLLTVFCASPATMKKPWIAPSINGRVIADMSRPTLLVKEI